MSTITVPRSEATREQLRRRASERGMPLEELARTVLECEAGVPVPEKSAEEWVAEWRAWIASRLVRELSVDDSGESIYEGRGQ
ncbi:MAG TPA: hypothetical protein VKE74_19495 [Gemmataceae bacterium]|nr:hypothetical protein [Gemmataceae bacterium]